MESRRVAQRRPRRRRAPHEDVAGVGDVYVLMIVIERAVGVLVLGVTRHVVERYMLLQLWLASLWYTRYRAPRMSYVGGARAFIRRRA